MTREEQLIWAAGFFDGEGCVYIVRYEFEDRFAMQCNCANTSVEALELLVSLFGGSICYKQESRENRKPCYIWSLCAGNAAVALDRMLPYLVVKRRQAEIAIAFQVRRATTPKTDLRHTLDAQDYKTVRELKQGIGV